MNLLKYLDEKVKIELKNGKNFIGYVGDYEYPDENDKNKEFIVLDLISQNIPIGIYEDEIKSIEIVK